MGMTVFPAACNGTLNCYLFHTIIKILLKLANTDFSSSDPFLDIEQKTHHTAHPCFISNNQSHVFFLCYHYIQFMTSSQNNHIYVSLDVPT
jgi:hypothetical protein